MKILLFLLLLLALPANAQVVKTTSGNAVAATSGGKPLTVGPASRVSLVSGQGIIPNILNTTASQACMTRKAYINYSNTTRFSPIFLNWYDTATQNNNTGMELGPGNTVTIKAWIEYPLTTYTQFLFSGGTTLTAADASTNQADFLSISIPNGAVYYIWTYITGAGGNNFPYYNSNGSLGDPLFYSTNGGLEAANCGTSGVPTTPGAISDNLSGRRGYYPVAVLGDTTQPTFALIGDSRTSATNEVADYTYNLGNLARSVGATNAYINMGVSGDRMGAYWSSHALRDALITFVNPSAIISELGTNEFNQQNATTTQWEAIAKNYMAHLVNTFPTLPIYRTTMEPWTTSSDTFATPVPSNWGVSCLNQTGTAYNANNTTENQHIRGNTFDSIPYQDIALGVLTAQDSGCWKANGIASYFTNGGHETAAGSKLIVASKAINPRTIAATAPIAYSYPAITLAGGSPAYTTGEFSQAAVLNGSTQVTATGFLPGVPQYTSECWVNLTAITGSTQYFYQSGDSIYASATNGFVSVRDGGGAFHVGTVPMPTAGWHHIAETISPGIASNSTTTVYLDGTSALTYTSSANSITVNNATGFIAGSGSGGSSFYMTGAIDECAIWNYVKYTGTFTPPVAPYTGTEPGLMAVYHFDNSLTGTRGPAGM